MRKRIIPVLLLDRDKRLVKTEQFGKRTYVGDPFNIVRLFNEKAVDELCILDIDATRDKRAPDFNFLKNLASECFMPLTYGGGISSLIECERLNRDGIEKFVLGNSALRLDFVNSLCQIVGSQAVVGCIDVMGRGNKERCVTTSGETALKPEQFCKMLENAGIGEIILQSIYLDGLRSGYDLDLINRLTQILTVPLIALGGAGTSQHLVEGLNSGASAVASGSAFTFIGRLRAVLINYPDPAEIDLLMNRLNS